uniref:TRAP C4-dicarboxylate transport system permease DctM subunit domain-containing protein n=1 Tax=uncultured Thiotrichaceae bacterium TaxID=298394 RepID=A0A6S6UFL8_9GAMM|nr:MAG: TRAP dicarboxylate transporter, DctM subunit, unknown substrate 6 [uncultured Thiotrichaceae bacterium]
MELVFLGILLFLMIWALTSGYPVAFALPGSAIIAIGLASLSGYLFEGNTSAYFAEDGPVQWLSAGVTNFRSLYWIVERDTLIAIPLFIFMGIMLQRSKIAEDLLVAMAQLFGPLPGGLGISVVFVGALLAATTGIVGATVIAMGLISLPAMLRNNYSKSLATGTICASGTLGQIIPPSIVLIILADQLSSAADQANTARKELYRATTGEYSMPSQFEVVSASAGDMFMGALIPGMILVGIYMLYILIVAWIKPSMAPPVPYDGDYDAKFARTVFLALVPPLTLIFVVLGSIITGVATVNQAGAIGAVGAMIMAGYRLYDGKWGKYIPAILAIGAVLTIAFVKAGNDLNIRNIQSDAQNTAILIAAGAVGVLLISVAWSAWRTLKVDNTLFEVMIETAKTTSMVFIILIGAAMLTSAFRAFGGEELVKHYLTGLPGGFWTQFLVVMLVIFLLGFFLDFIEIAVVVVPIVAPILLMNPEANITAVWLGVMIGLNIQTSFLTPPFGFALFYLRGVADKVVKTMDIYKGAVAFICLQLLGLAIAGYFPSLVNYLPNRTHLLSETSPPPINPKLQVCLEDYVGRELTDNKDEIQAALNKAQGLDVSVLPEKLQNNFKASVSDNQKGFELFDAIQTERDKLAEFEIEYTPVHRQVRSIQREMGVMDTQIEGHKTAIQELKFDKNSTDADKDHLTQLITELEAAKVELEASIPEGWDDLRKQFKAHTTSITKAQRTYFQATDGAYEKFAEIRDIINGSDALKATESDVMGLASVISDTPAAEAMDAIKVVEGQLGEVAGASAIKSSLSKARRTLKKDDSAEGRSKAMELFNKAKDDMTADIKWRGEAAGKLLPELASYDEAIAGSLGIRMQKRLTDPQAKDVAACMSHHTDVSLHF